ncbi:MAG TPA: ferredoxin reductase family protein [Xanthomonadaceae bacterium]|nr:ferredoxin reductase family protein [Xanthomonadaceae bacterium]
MTRSSLTWLLVYLALVFVPLLVLMTGDLPRGGGFWWDFSMLLGYAGLSMMGVQFALTARFRRATAPFGIDLIYYFHRYLAVIGFLLILLHVAIVAVVFPQVGGGLDPRSAPWYMTAGRVAVVLFGVVIVSSLWRKPLRIEYDAWRLWHGLLSSVALLLSVAHVVGSAHYLNEPLKRWVWMALALFWLLLIAHVRLVRPWLSLRRPWRVVEVRKEAGRTWSIAVEPTGHDGMDFHPGQFAWLSLGRSPYALKEHPFSIASAPGARRLEFAIKELGDFTNRIGQTPLDQVAYVDGPYGNFSIDRHPRAAGYVFIAGGVGAAPVMSMLRTLAARSDTRRHWLFYGNRVLEIAAFREEIQAIAGRIRLEVVHVLTEPPPDWQGERGFVDREVLMRHLPADRSELDYFVCGPTPMIRLAERSLRALGVPLSRVHSEIFDLA